MKCRPKCKLKAKDTAQKLCLQIRPTRAAAGPVNPQAAGDGAGAGTGATGMSITCSLINSFSLNHNHR